MHHIPFERKIKELESRLIQESKLNLVVGTLATYTAVRDDVTACLGSINCQGVEMEAFAFMRLVSLMTNDQVKLLPVVKGVSDIGGYGNKVNRERDRSIAARNACEVYLRLLKLLQASPDLLD